MNVSATYQQAQSLLQQGQFARAQGLYEEILAADHQHLGAIKCLGLIAGQSGDLERAADLFGRAVAIDSRDPAACNNLGMAQEGLGRLDEALASYERAIALKADYGIAHFNRGNVLWKRIRHEDALASYGAAQRFGARHPQLYQNQGIVLSQMGRLDEALDCLNHALQLQPNNAAVLGARGDVLVDLQRPDEALPSFEAALQADPANVKCLIGRGHCLRALQRHADAIASYDAALRLDPDSVIAHYGKGTAYLQWDAQLEEALTSFARALRDDPFQCDYAIGTLLITQGNAADWSSRSPEARPDRLVESVLSGRRAAHPFHLLSVTDSGEAQRRCAQVLVADRCAGGKAGWDGEAYRHERIRVAYVSSDLREHAVSYLMAGVFERHDPRRFETIAISLTPEDDSALGRRVKNSFTRFVDASRRSDREVTALMREMQVDIAVDLNGFTDGYRPQIFMNRAAPVQVNYLGFPGTLGAPYMDYILADEFVIPAEQQRHYDERVVYLPDCFQANDDQRAISERVFTRAELGLPERGFVFCSFNHTHKINARMFDAWAHLLERVPGSVLWLLSVHDAVRQNLEREAAQRGVDPKRLVFAQRMPYPEHLKRLQLADLFLDTVPFNAGTTASDALWAGLPLLSCAGEAFAARMAGSLLRCAGLPELITTNLEQYQARGVELATDPGKLAALRQRLWQSRERSALFNTDRFVRHLESAYQTMAERHRRGLPPAAFSVASPAAAGS